MIHVGQRIKDELERQDRTISWLARKLNCNRSRIYRTLEKTSIDTNLLKQISVILNHNFLQELAEDFEEKAG